MTALRRARGPLAAALGIGLLLSACSGSTEESSGAAESVASPAASAATPDGSALPAPGEPIVIGSVNSLTGPVPFPDVPAAAKAVFDKVNAEGGINGRPIEFFMEDDKGDPTVAAQAARRLVDENGVVAMAGSASLVECSANATFYQQSDVRVVSGTGVDPACFNTPNISPTNTGPFEGYTALMYYGSEVLGAEKICAIVQTLPGLTEGYMASIDRWKQITGKEPALVDTSVAFGDDPTPAILAVKDAGCDVATFNSTEPVTVNFMRLVKQQGLLDTVKWVTLTSSFTDSSLQALQEQDTLGLYVNSEFEPYILDNEATADWRATLTAAGLPLTSLSQGGYVAAKVMVDVLKSIEGDVTRESVNAALQALTDYPTLMMGTPYSFGTASAHNPNRASKFVQATADGWVLTTDEWITLPEQP